VPPMMTPIELEPESPSVTVLVVGSVTVTVMVESDSTVIPSAAEAAAAVPRVEESEVCTVAAVMEAGTVMVAVMITLAAATLIVTNDLSTPAAVAIFCCKLEVSE
jgi:hypothetical protein